MKKSLSLALLAALAVGAVPLAASASSNVSVGIGISSGPYYAPPPPYYYPAAPVRRALPQRDIEILLINKGYRVEHIDRRGNAYFVRVVYGYDIYDGLIDCYNGAWVTRDRVGYIRNNGYWTVSGGYWNGWSSRYGWGPPRPYPRAYYYQAPNYWSGWNRDWNRDRDNDRDHDHDRDRDHDGDRDGHWDRDRDHDWDRDR